MSATPEIRPKSESGRKRTPRQFAWWKLLTLAGLICAGTLWISSSWLDVYLVTEQSMWPTLLGGKDRILVNKLGDQPKRRWEVWLDAGDGSRRRPFVKRIVGLPNEWVDFRSGDIWIATEGLPCERATRPTAVVEAQRIPVYPSGEGRYGEDRWRVTPRGALTMKGRSLVLEAEEQRGAEARLLSGVVSRGLEANIRDDHLSLAGAHIGGSEVVADIRIDFQLAEVTEGVKVRMIHALASESEDVQLEWQGNQLFLLRGRSPQGSRRALPGGPLSLPLALRIDTLDGILTVATLRKESERWVEDRVLYRGARNTADHGAHSQVSLSIEGSGRVRFDDLSVTRDVYWAWPRSRQGQAPTASGTGYFLLGDNGPVSEDSRHRGPTPEERLMGRVRSIIWPRGGWQPSFP